jgi:hypothetical protein
MLNMLRFKAKLIYVCILYYIPTKMKYKFPTTVLKLKNCDLTKEQIEFKNWYYSHRSEKAFLKHSESVRNNYQKNREQRLAYITQWNKDNRKPTGNPIGRPRKTIYEIHADANETKFINSEDCENPVMTES